MELCLHPAQSLQHLRNSTPTAATDVATDQGDCLRSCLDFSGDFRSARHPPQPLPLTKDSSGARAIVSLKRQRKEGATAARGGKLTSSAASGSDQQRAVGKGGKVRCGQVQAECAEISSPASMIDWHGYSSGGGGKGPDQIARRTSPARTRLSERTRSRIRRAASTPACYYSTARQMECRGEPSGSGAVDRWWCRWCA